MAPGRGRLDWTRDPLRSAVDLVLEFSRSDGLAAVYGAVASDVTAEARDREISALFSVAEKFLDSGRTENALELALEALDAARAWQSSSTASSGGSSGSSSRGSSAAVDLLRLVLHCFRAQGKRQFASQMAHEELTLLQAAGDDVGQAKISLAIAELDLDVSAQATRLQGLQRGKEALAALQALQAPRTQALASLVVARAQLVLSDATGKEAARQCLLTTRQAVSLYEGLRDRTGQARALQLQAAACALAGQSAPAMQAASAALDIARQLRDKHLEALSLLSLATWRVLLGEPLKALPAAEESLQLCRQARCGLAWEAAALATVGQAQCAQPGGARGAVSVLKEGLQRLRAREGEDERAEARVLDALLHAHAACGDVRMAVRAAERARAAYRGVGDGRKEVWSLCAASRLQTEMQGGQAELGLEVAQEALALTRDAEACDQAEAMLQVARARLSLGHFSEARQAAGDASSIFHKEGLTAGEARAQVLVGEAHLQAGSAQRAWTTLEEARALCREVGDVNREAHALCLGCEAQLLLGAWERAARGAEDARALWEEVGDLAGEVGALLLRAKASLRQLMQEEEEGGEEGAHLCRVAALSAAGEAVSLCREDEEEHRNLLSHSLFMLAQAELKDSRPDAAIEDAEEAAELFAQAGDSSSQAAALDAVARAWAMMGGLAKAKSAAQQAHRLFLQVRDEQGQDQMTTLLEQLDGRQLPEPLRVTPAPVEQPARTLPAEERKAPRALSLVPLDTSGGVSVDLVQSRLRDILNDLIGSDDIELDTGLLTAGLTSTTAVMFTNAIARDFPSVSLPVTLAFDYPSIGDISQLVCQKM